MYWIATERMHLCFFGFSRMDGKGWVLCICTCYVVTSYKSVECTIKCILGGQLRWLFSYSSSLALTPLFTLTQFVCLINVLLLLLLLAFMMLVSQFSMRCKAPVDVSFSKKITAWYRSTEPSYWRWRPLPNLSQHDLEPRILGHPCFRTSMNTAWLRACSH